MAGQVICDSTTDTGRARYRKESERSQLQDSFAELSQAERRIMSIREREKGNEYFNLLEMTKLCHAIAKVFSWTIPTKNPTRIEQQYSFVNPTLI